MGSKISWRLKFLLGLFLIIFCWRGFHFIEHKVENVPPIQEQLGISQAQRKSDKKKNLAELNYQSGHAPVVKVNGNHSTLDPQSWTNLQTPRIEFSNLDLLNRANGKATAYLTKANVTNGDLRTRQTFRPTGWHQKRSPITGQAIYNRGHLIAYSISKGIDNEGHYQATNLTGDQDNPHNLFTQSAFSNQRLQTIYEQKVRAALLADKKVIYQAQPMFRGSELMARGIHLQAISTDRSLDFNVYIFNVQPQIKFNYQTGSSQSDPNMAIPNGRE